MNNDRITPTFISNLARFIFVLCIIARIVYHFINPNL